MVARIRGSGVMSQHRAKRRSSLSSCLLYTSYSRFEELKYSFEEAQNALEYSTLLRKEGRLAAYIKDMEPEDTTVRLQLEEQDERLLMNAVKSNNMEKAEKQISRFFERLEQARLPFCQYQMYILEIFTVLMLSLIHISSSLPMSSVD